MCYKFSFCAENCVEQYKPHLSVNSDTELFLLPGLPNKIEMTRLHFPDIPDEGLIIRGWTPQLMILEHPAVGGQVIHCGWNSFLEGVTAGLPMITWPIFAEQFYHEKFVTEVLKIGG